MINEKKLEEFQKDLKQGMTIEEALKKHGFTFKYVCENLPRAYRKKQRRRKRRKR